jgi:hypothetical protein
MSRKNKASIANQQDTRIIVEGATNMAHIIAGHCVADRKASRKRL